MVYLMWILSIYCLSIVLSKLELTAHLKDVLEEGGLDKAQYEVCVKISNFLIYVPVANTLISIVLIAIYIYALWQYGTDWIKYWTRIRKLKRIIRKGRIPRK